LTRRASGLAARANARLAALGAPVADGQFICPLCLRLLPASDSTTAHFPARTLPGAHRTELLCRDCNSNVGATFENLGVDFLTRTWQVDVGRDDAGDVRLRAGISRGPGGEIIINAKTRGGDKRRSRKVIRALDEIRARSARPHELDFRLQMPAEEHPRRALAFWSYLAWFAVSGYRWVDSAGAHAVRRFLVDPHSPMPWGAYFSHGPVSVPLDEPRPVLIVRSDEEQFSSIRDIDEFIGLGVQWGPAVSVFPFANDDRGVAWRRLGDLVDHDGLRTVRRLDLQKLLAGQGGGGGLDAITIQRDGVDVHIVTEEARPADVAALAEGRSPRVLDPRLRAPYRALRDGERHEFTVVASPEFGGPTPPVDRVWCWRGCAIDFGDDVRRIHAAGIPPML
jgi:hypothetical protein